MVTIVWLIAKCGLVHDSEEQVVQHRCSYCISTGACMYMVVRWSGQLALWLAYAIIVTRSTISLNHWVIITTNLCQKSALYK